MPRQVFGSALDALVIIGLVGGAVTAVFMRVGRNTTPGDLLLQRFLGSRS